jgi:hypothetical protein
VAVTPLPAPGVQANRQTKGFVGLWTEPASKKLNGDFEWAKEHMEMGLEDQPTNPALPVTSRAAEALSGAEHPAKEEKYTFLAESPTFSKNHTAAMTPASASTTDGMAKHTIDFEDRLRRLNAELEIEDSGDDDDSALSTPTISEPRVASLQRNPPSSPQSSRRPVLTQLDTATPRYLNNAGLEILSATRYTPDSSSGSASSNLLSPHSAALRPRQLLRTQPQPQPHLWERDIGPSPSQLPPAPPAPLRTQSTRQPRPEASRVSSVKNMWEKRASLVMDAPGRLKMGSRNGSKSPPEPLRLQSANTAFASIERKGHNRLEDRYEEVRREARGDSATVPSFEIFGVGSGQVGRGGQGMDLGQGPGMESPLLSPLSPGVAAY